MILNKKKNGYKTNIKQFILKQVEDIENLPEYNEDSLEN